MTNEPFFYWWGFRVKARWGMIDHPLGTMWRLGWLDIKVLWNDAPLRSECGGAGAKLEKAPTTVIDQRRKVAATSDTHPARDRQSATLQSRRSHRNTRSAASLPRSPLNAQQYGKFKTTER